MAKPQSRKLAVILHADVVGSTSLVRRDETLAHDRIQAAFGRLSKTVDAYGGATHEIRGDALVAAFSRASDAVCAAIAFQNENTALNAALGDDFRPELRIGISMGEVVVADNTITGEGVVLAQRLEQIADAGGICIQGAVYEIVPKRLPFQCEDRGAQTLKGFEAPVRAYGVVLKAGEIVPPPESSSPSQKAALRLSDKPSIAVLPFRNLSDDPEQEYFADGVVEDIITDLSRFKELLVIARHSSFSYKGSSTTIQSVASELGVRYIVQGSIQRAAGRVRINAQLIDATDDSHLWAERYDRELSDLFAVQDEIVETIVRTVAARLERHGLENVIHKVEQDFRAYDYILQARAMICDSAESNRRCRELYESALQVDPRSATACCGISMTHSMDYNSGWSESPERSFEQALSYALKAVALDDDNSQAHSRLGAQRLWRREYDLAEMHLDKALALNPNDPYAWAYKGLYLIYTGRPEEALLALERATERNPFEFTWYLWFVGLAYYSARRYDEAIAPLRRSIEKNPSFIAPRRHLAACYAQLGRDEAAAEQTAKILELEPAFSIERLSSILSYRDSSDLEHYLDGLRKAGLPD